MEKCKKFVSVYKIFENFLLQTYSSRILRYCTQGVLVIKVCSNGAATYIIGEIIENIENLMQTFEYLLLQTTQNNS